MATSKFRSVTSRHGIAPPTGGLALLVAFATVFSVVFGGAIAPSVANASSAKHSGTVDVLYAGSLLDLMQQQIGPAFHKATGYTVSGISAGSSALATEIKGGTEAGDVFISASPTADASLMGSSNGNWVTSYQEFGRSPLVLGYYSSSSFSKALRTQPWYNVVTEPGFLLGRTDPATDPKGVLAVDALTGVALSYGVPQLAALATSTSNVFAETSLVGELQAGQLDAGFFYGVEASAAKLKTVPLVGTGLFAKYTITLLRNAPHVAAAQSFISFLLSKAGRKILKMNGIAPIVPALSFNSSNIPTTTTTAG
jgi:molybdate/tungstate transport system substrate-binding protein